MDNETVRRGGDVDWATADKFETFQPHLAPSELNDFVRKIQIKIALHETHEGELECQVSTLTEL